jgi:hypothetical protein
LAEAAAIAPNIESWRRFCAPFVENPAAQSGDSCLLVCVNRLGYLKGLCLARPQATEDGLVLDVPVHVVASVADEEGVRLAFRDRLEMMASAAGCRSVTLPA